jgi:hypothetical protein
VVLLITGLLAFNILADSKADITDVIERSYFNGASNDLDTKSMREGFHPDFAIYFLTDGISYRRYPIDEWIINIEKYKASPEFDKEKSKADFKIVSIDVTGTCASVKIEMRGNDKLLWTDYLSLLKLENGWKIIAKVAHKHE